MKILIAMILNTIPILIWCQNDPPALELFGGGADLVQKREYAAAIEVYRRVVKEYPKDPLAADAQYRLGDLFSVYARDFKQAIDEYKLVVNNYHNSPFAINAQFMIGYIYANFLGDAESAKKEYQNFLNHFSKRAPENLVKSVEFELEFLGKEIKDIPQLKDSTN